MSSGGQKSSTYRDKLDNEPNLLSHDKNRINYSSLNQSQQNVYCWEKYPKCARCGMCLIGTLLFIIAIQATFLPKLLENAISSGIEDALIFTSEQKDNSNYQTWLTNAYGDNAVPIWTECRFFNVTNADELLLPPSDKNENWTYPKLHLTDPLIYDEYYLKYAVNHSFGGYKEWVEYQTWTYYKYPSNAQQTLNYDNVLHPNDHIVIISPVIGLLYYEWLWPKDGSKIAKIADEELSKLLNNIDPNLLFWKGTAEEILFNISQINVTIDGRELFSYQLNQGLLGNGSAPDSETANSTYEVLHTGHNAPDRMGEVLFYGDKQKGWIDCYDTPLQIWPAKDTFFGLNNVRPHDQQTLFVDSLFFNARLNWNYSFVWKNDIELYRYTVQIYPQYLNASQWPPNAQFNMFGTAGVQNLTSCMTLPIFVSFPEFVGADDFIKNNSKMGLDPNPSWDTVPTVDVEPRTGAIYRANKSLQLNTIIQSLPFGDLRNYNRSLPFNQSQIYKDRTEQNRLLFGNRSLHWIADGLVVPMVELSECTELPDKQAKAFSDAVIGTSNWAKRLEWIGVVAGCLFALWATCLGYMIGRRGETKY